MTISGHSVSTRKDVLDRGDKEICRKEIDGDVGVGLEVTAAVSGPEVGRDDWPCVSVTPLVSIPVDSAGRLRTSPFLLLGDAKASDGDLGFVEAAPAADNAWNEKPR